MAEAGACGADRKGKLRARTAGTLPLAELVTGVTRSHPARNSHRHPNPPGPGPSPGTQEGFLNSTGLLNTYCGAPTSIRAQCPGGDAQPGPRARGSMSPAPPDRERACLVGLTSRPGCRVVSMATETPQQCRAMLPEGLLAGPGVQDGDKRGTSEARPPHGHRGAWPPGLLADRSSQRGSPEPQRKLLSPPTPFPLPSGLACPEVTPT